MKIYGPGIYDNERADMVGICYIEYSLAEIESAIEWLQSSNETCQPILAFIDMLLLIGEKAPGDLTGRLKTSTVTRWEGVFNDWYARVKSKIPKKYREPIEADAEKLFSRLREKSCSIEWL